MSTLLIDSHCLGYQARYALGSLSHDDLRTGTIFGFLSAVLQLGIHFQTNDILFFWDSKKSIRKEDFSGYKNRPLKPEEAEERRIMREQLKKLRREILPQIGFRSNFIQSGIESDDLLASYVKGRTGEFIIVSSDEDLFQCLTQQNVRIYSPTKKRIMTRGRFTEEYGIAPRQWVQMKCIAGCRSDTVPGIRGVGEITAIKYLRGELKKDCQAMINILSSDGQKILQRNFLLVALPHVLTMTSFPEKKNRLTWGGFRGVCQEYGFQSFLEGEKKDEWKSFFNMTQTD